MKQFEEILGERKESYTFDELVSKMVELQNELVLHYNAEVQKTALEYYKGGMTASVQILSDGIKSLNNIENEKN